METVTQTDVRRQVLHARTNARLYVADTGDLSAIDDVSADGSSYEFCYVLRNKRYCSYSETGMSCEPVREYVGYRHFPIMGLPHSVVTHTLHTQQ